MRGLRTTPFRLGLLCVPAILLGLGAAFAQIPDTFTNLKVLPKDIGKRELVSIMRGYAGSLGVRCSHCHVPGEDPTSLEGFDFASDEPETKNVARAMMKMTQEINEKLLPTTGRDPIVEVRCVTCHHGVVRPEGLDQLLTATMEKDGVEGAIARYRELREMHYGTAAYDFSPHLLNGVVESVAEEKQDVDGAIALGLLNLEFNPEDAYTHLLVGRLYSQKGDKESAIKHIEKSLELEPGNEWATRALEEVKAK